MSGQKYLKGSSVIVIVRCLQESCNKILANGNLTSIVSDVVQLLISGLAKRFRGIEQSGTLSLCTFTDSRFKVQGFSDKNEAKKTKEKVKKLVTSIINDQEDCTIENQPVQEKETDKDDLSPWCIFDQLIGDVLSTRITVSRVHYNGGKTIAM
ncbi:unnamed protein product [Diabrotica balteata]|uniref:Uncharacterized protein n=1 Tax=Diabrotica balteata TaxID=107213 RepID=A0A9N9XAF2_DIABA|nr:unnamed protein product [Diabrotica balteata]